MNRARIIRITLFALLSAALLTGCSKAPDATAPDIDVSAHSVDKTLAALDSGVVRGVERAGVVAFKGMPYAQAPVGELRWAATRPVPAWEDIRDAADYGADCMQKPFPSDAAPLGTTPAEDCLFVNVWREAADNATPRPVVVWIHGGGFVNGGSSPAVYDGSQFARQGVVFVSFNYRLGRFGFFAHPALTAEDGGLGNYGYLDQVAALHWVQRNIGAFNGDPGAVTIMGESAGGGSVINLMSAAEAAGTFQRAIIMSGGGRGPLMGPRLVSTKVGESESAEWFGLNFAAQFGIEGTGADALAALRALTADEVTDGLDMMSMRSKPTYAGGPLADGATSYPHQTMPANAHRLAPVPVLIGTTSMDIGFGYAQSKDELFESFGAAADQARSAYDPDDVVELSSLNMLTAADRMMHEPAHYFAARVAASGQNAWLYRFSYVAQSMRSQWPGAPHATDIPFFFDTIAAKYGDALTAQDQRAAELSLQYFVDFVRTGDPNSGSEPHWPAYSAQTPLMLDIGMDASASVGTDPLQSRIDAVRAAYNLQ